MASGVGRLPSHLPSQPAVGSLVRPTLLRVKVDPGRRVWSRRACSYARRQGPPPRVKVVLRAERPKGIPEPMFEVDVSSMSPERFRDVLSPRQAEAFERGVREARELLSGRVVWNVNSTARGGGVAELLASLVAYARGAGVDVRWAVIEGSPVFFAVTKRIHNRLHGAPGDG